MKYQKFQRQCDKTAAVKTASIHCCFIGPYIRIFILCDRNTILVPYVRIFSFMRQTFVAVKYYATNQICNETQASQTTES